MIKIDGKQLQFRWNFAAQYEFEAVTGVPFDASKTMHRHLIYWCMLRVNNKESYDEDFDQFVERLNNEPVLVNELETGFLELMKARREATESTGTEDQSKKD